MFTNFRKFTHILFVYTFCFGRQCSRFPFTRNLYSKSATVLLSRFQHSTVSQEIVTEGEPEVRSVKTLFDQRWLCFRKSLLCRRVVVNALRRVKEFDVLHNGRVSRSTCLCHEMSFRRVIFTIRVLSRPTSVPVKSKIIRIRS